MLVSIGQPSKTGAYSLVGSLLALLASQVWVLVWEPLPFPTPPTYHFPIFYIALQATKKEKPTNVEDKLTKPKNVQYDVLDCVLGHWLATHRCKKTHSITVYLLSLWNHEDWFSVGSRSPSWEQAESQDWERNVNYVSVKGVRVWSRVIWFFLDQGWPNLFLKTYLTADYRYNPAPTHLTVMFK